MNLQHRGREPVALGLQDNCIYLAPDKAMRPFAKTAEFFRCASQDPEFMDGCVLALHYVNGPNDVHYPVWEMHPQGDEILILTSGSLSVELREAEKERTVPLPAQGALIVPAGTWHRLIVHELSVMIALTPRHNTRHEKA